MPREQKSFINLDVWDQVVANLFAKINGKGILKRIMILNMQGKFWN